MDIRKIDAILAARRLLKADKPKPEDEQEGAPPSGYESWEEFNRVHPRGAGGRFGSGGGSNGDTVASPKEGDESKKLENLTIGSDRPGYIPPVATEDSKEFPDIVPTEDGPDMWPAGRMKLAATLAYMADVDPRFKDLKSSDGKRISLTNGMLDPVGNRNITSADMVQTSSTGAIMNSAISTAAVANIAGATTTNVVQGAAAGAIGGAFAGIIAGVAMNAAVRSSLEDLSKTSPNSYGPRREAVGAQLAGRLVPATDLEFSKVSPGVYRTSYVTSAISPDVAQNKDVVMGSDRKPQERHAVQVDAIMIYRGDAYKAKYPETDGWEASITNIAAGPAYKSEATQGLYMASTLEKEVRANLPPAASMYQEKK